MSTRSYPVVLTVVLGFPVLVIGLIVFAIVGDRNGSFDTGETVVFGAMIVLLIVCCIADLVRWESWKRTNR